MTGDNVGLQIRSTSQTVTTVLTCMEITDAVVDEAIDLGAHVIVTFHPLIYSPLLRLDDSERVTRLVARCIRASISVYCVHTAFDAHPRGTNWLLATRLGLFPQGPLTPSTGVSDSNEGSFGMGLLADCEMTFDELIDRIAAVCGAPVRFVAPPVAKIQRVALVAGSGMSFFDAVLGKADVFITADVKYHAFHAADGVIGLVDPGHYEMEQFVAAGIARELSMQLPECVVHCSTVMTNPVRHLVTPTTIENSNVSV